MSRKKSLTEQIAELSTTRPVSFHPDEEELSDLTAARLSEFRYNEENGNNTWSQGRPAGGHVRFRAELEEDPKYAGRRVSRKDLDDSLYDLHSDEDSDRSEQDSDIIEESDQSDSSEEEDFDESPDVMEDGSHDEEEEEMDKEGDEGLSLAHLQDDIKKGEAVKQQLGMWDGLLEARICLQKVLLLCNQLPQHQAMESFMAAGGAPLNETMKESQLKLRKLFDELLELQQMLFSKNKELNFLGGQSADQSGDGADSLSDNDEEIPSDDDDINDTKNSNSAINSDQMDSDNDVILSKGSRKQKCREWVTAGGQRDYESHVSKVHRGFHPYRDATLTKWSNKTQLASGKITSKAFVQVDRNVLTQIEHVLKDKDRLLKRTRLKRSIYRVLGSSEGAESEGGDNEQSEQGRDAHLKDCDEEIFDDDDFYHQLLRELIERKMDFTVTSDPVAMGRQWLELQKLRTKAKKKVDTKASKGRKMRYNVHPKLTNFMVPIDQGQHWSDLSRNDLFSSLFGAHQSIS